MLDRIEALKSAGVQIGIFQADVANRQQIGTVFDTIEETMPALKGVFHAAGVLDDGLLANMDWERTARVMSPKVDGAWNLHKLTERNPSTFLYFTPPWQRSWDGQGRATMLPPMHSWILWPGIVPVRGCPPSASTGGRGRNPGWPLNSEVRHRQRFLDRGLHIIDSDDGFLILEKLDLDARTTNCCRTGGLEQTRGLFPANVQ